MRGFNFGSIVLVALAWMAAGCADSELEYSPFSSCTVYEADGMMFMQCPLASLNRREPDLTPHKSTPTDRVQKPLLACPVSQCYQEVCWNLCELEGDICIYSRRPQDRPRVPGNRQKTAPETELLY